MKIRDIITEAELSPSQQAAMRKIELGVTTSPEEREERYRKERERRAAEMPDPEAERAKRQAQTDEIIAFAKKNGYDLEPQDVNAFVRGVDDGEHGTESRRAGDTEGPHYNAYFHGTQIGRKMKGKSLGESGPGVTTSSDLGTVINPHYSPGTGRGKKSYIGNPKTGESGKKAPPQPKVNQPKEPDGTAKPAHKIKSASLFGGPAVVKR